MAEISNPIALAHAQGVQAGKFAEGALLECPWPIHEYDACLAWFSGFAVGALARSSNAPARGRLSYAPDRTAS